MYIATAVGIYDHGVVAHDIHLDKLKEKVIAHRKTEDDYHEYRIERLPFDGELFLVGRYLKVNQTHTKPKHGFYHVGKVGTYNKHPNATWVFLWEDKPDYIEIPDET